jgi:signal transduction histidine kinase/ligand-binding sensor domain-containing protein
LLVAAVQVKRAAVRLAFLLALVGAASSSAWAERLPIRVYTTADGLGSSAINYMMRDSRGFLWFCTRDGLSRFDGYRFTTYSLGGETTYPTINHIIERRNGQYLISTNGGGIYRFDPNAAPAGETSDASAPKGKEAAVLNAQRVLDSSAGMIYEDRNGRLWVSADHYLQDEADGRLSLRRLEMNLSADEERLIGGGSVFCEGRDGSLWIGGLRGLMRRLPDGRMIHFSILPTKDVDGVPGVFEDREGRIWAAHSRSGLFVINPAPIETLNGYGGFTTQRLVAEKRVTNPRAADILLPQHAGQVFNFTTADGLAHNGIYGLFQTSNATVWITTDDGLSEFDGKRFRSYTLEHGLAALTLGQLAEDVDGNLWIGSSSGPMKLALNGLTSYTESDGLGDPRTTSIYEGREGELYAVSSSWRISRLDGRSFKSVRANMPVDAVSQWTSNVSFLDSRGEWWMLTIRGLYRFPAVSRLEDLSGQRPSAIYDGRNGLKNEFAYRMFEDQRGDLWVSTRSADTSLNGVARIERATEKFHVFSEAEGLPSHKAPSAFSEDRAGNLWMGFYEGQMARYAAGRFTIFTTDDGVPAGLITSLHLDSRGRLWISSSHGGLARIDDPSAARPEFKHYTTADGLSSNNTRCIVEDLLGRIYVGTVRGLDRLIPETGRVKHYSRADGLIDDFVYVSHRDRQGTLWFGTLNGLSRLDPQPDRAQSPPPVLIDGLRVSGNRRPISELGVTQVSGLELSHVQNTLQIDFLSIGFSGNIRYQYMFEGVDREWSQPTEQRSVYATLAPGKYRFLVRAINADGVTTINPAIVSFTIQPPLWQRWWFLTLIALTLGALAYALYRYRVAQLLKVERVRTRIATDLHDDIGASLSRMAIMSEVVKQQTAGTNGQSGQLLTEIADSARGLVDSMSDIVWSIDPRRDDLKSVVLRVRQFAGDVLEARGLNWEFHVPAELEKIKLDPEQRRHLFLIFKESINNIARHAEGASSAKLSMQVRGRQLIGEIRDDGHGFERKSEEQARTQSRGGNGLPNMQARAEQLGGRLDIDSKPGAGTRLTLVVPLN